MKDRDPAARRAAAFAAVIVGLVATYDLAVGLAMIFSPAPWLAHGPGTVWTRAAAELGDDAVSQALRASWARIGAFSTFAGASTWVWLIRGLRDPSTLTTLLVVYLLVGTAFGLTDAAWFGGTTYITVKHGIGVLWLAALGAQLWARRRDAATATISA